MKKSLQTQFLLQRISLFVEVLEAPPKYRSHLGPRPTPRRVAKVLRSFIDRVTDPTICGADCKAMYFCTLKKGHTGQHSEDGQLTWPRRPKVKLKAPKTKKVIVNPNGVANHARAAAFERRRYRSWKASCVDIARTIGISDEEFLDADDPYDVFDEMAASYAAGTTAEDFMKKKFYMEHIRKSRK